MMRKAFFSVVLCLGGLAFAAGEPAIDLAQADPSGVRVLRDFSATPANGVLQSWRLRLPAFTRGCFFSADGSSLPGNANRVLPWVFAGDARELLRATSAQNPAVGKPSPMGIFSLFALPSGRVLAVLPLTGPDTIAWLEIDDHAELALRVGTFGTTPVRGDTPLLAWAGGANAAEATRLVWEAALRSGALDRSTNWRREKAYPEPFRYLGWCTWEQYKKKIDSALVTRSVADLEKSGLPIRWVLVDDGHQQGTIVKGAGRGRLRSFTPDPQTFPEGWKPLMAMRNPDGIRWFGLWHAFLGLWENIDPENDFDALRGHLMKLGDGTLVPREDPASAAAFYDALIASVKHAGFDFVKIDVQTSGLAHYRGEANAVRASAENSQALERAVNAGLLGMINCMAQNPVCVFNTRYSAVTRCSIDYYKGNALAAKSHLLQSYANSLWLGQTVWPDHDMFHSSEKQWGRLMAVSKAMSAGPIYVSDAPADLAAGNIRPLCFADGELLRPLAPAVPLPDSVFAPVMNEPHAYRVIAPLANGAAAIVLYNLQTGKAAPPVEAAVEPRDYAEAGEMIQPYAGRWEAPPEGLFAYDSYAGRGTKLGQAWKVTLHDFSDRLLLLTPIRRGWSVIGRADKFLAPAAVVAAELTENEAVIHLRESGPLLVYSARRPAAETGETVTEAGPDTWLIDLPAGRSDYRVKLRR